MNYLTKPMKKIFLTLSLLLLTLLFATNTLASSGELEQDASYLYCKNGDANVT